ncbi:retrotransposon protein, putative, ty1-copia subclass [Tanacetum coccineum]
MECPERRNRTLLDMVRSMMNLTTLPLSFWDYALESATRILNMVPTKKVDKTPYELWYGKVQTVSYLKETQSKLWLTISISHLKTKFVVGKDKLNSLRASHNPEISGEGVDLEEIQEEEDTTPSEITSNIPQEVEGFEPPQEEVIPIRSIMYAVRCTRPDVAFAQNMTSRFQQNPGEPHWTAVKNILKRSGFEEFPSKVTTSNFCTESENIARQKAGHGSCLD